MAPRAPMALDHFRQTVTAICRPEPHPQDEQGNYICLWQECSEKNYKWGRLSEWNKHMDRHERPYKCEQLSCVNLPGFTYPGGINRHLREVHLVQPTRILCPFSGCDRNAPGNGFTRKENLAEHKRRRHPEENVSEDTPKEPEVNGKKRKHGSISGGSDGSSGSSSRRSTSHGYDRPYSAGSSTSPGQRLVAIATLEREYPIIKEELRRTKEQLREVLGERDHYKALLQSVPPQIYHTSTGPNMMAMPGMMNPPAPPQPPIHPGPGTYQHLPNGYVPQRDGVGPSYGQNQ
jgi:hypothetical protein